MAKEYVSDKEAEDVQASADLSKHYDPYPGAELAMIRRLLATRAALLNVIGAWYRNELSADDLNAFACHIRKD